MSFNEFASVEIKRSYFGMSVTNNVIVLAGKLLHDAVGWETLKELEVEHGDGHITMLYGHVPEKREEISKKLYGLISSMKQSDVRLDSFLLERVEVGFDECAVIGVLDPNLSDLRPLFSDLYKNVDYCRGHPDFRGPDKLNDPLWMKRTPHVTLMLFKDKGAAKMAAGILQEKIRLLRCADINLKHFFSKTRYDIGGRIIDEDDEYKE